jgi:site-specific DNA-methyltransferase (adenine-specific)
MTENLLYYGDNLDVLRRHVKDESVDLVYLDPPFNSNASYNILFAAKEGGQATAQIQGFRGLPGIGDEAGLVARWRVERREVTV